MGPSTPLQMIPMNRTRQIDRRRDRQTVAGGGGDYIIINSPDSLRLQMRVFQTDSD